MSIRILVTGASSPAAASVLQAVAGAGAVAFAADSNLYAPGLFLVEPARRAHLPTPDEPEMLSELLAFCVRHEIDAIIPTLDEELLPLAAARRRFHSLGIRLMLSSYESLLSALDPWQMIESCRGKVPVPRAALFDARFEPFEWRPPMVLRHRSGGAPRTILERTELDLYARSSEWIVHEALPGNRYEVDVLRLISGAVVATVPREILVPSHDLALTSRTFHDPRLEAMAATVVETLGLAHVVGVRFARAADGQIRLVGIEPRVPTSIAVTMASGLDLTSVAVHDILGSPFEAVGDFREVGVVRSSGMQLVPESEIRQAQNAPWPLGRSTHPGVVQ